MCLVALYILTLCNDTLLRVAVIMPPCDCVVKDELLMSSYVCSHSRRFEFGLSKYTSELIKTRGEFWISNKGWSVVDRQSEKVTLLRIYNVLFVDERRIPLLLELMFLITVLSKIESSD